MAGQELLGPGEQAFGGGRGLRPPRRLEAGSTAPPTRVRPAGASGRPAPDAGAVVVPRPARRALVQEGPQGGGGVVRDLARPHEVPERVEHRALESPARRGEEVGEEARALLGQMRAQSVVEVTRGPVQAGLVEEPEVVGQVQAEPAVAITERSAAHPHHLPRRAQRVEVGGTIAGQPRGQDVALEVGGREGRALELLDHVEEGVGSAATRGRTGSDPLPVEQGARQRLGLGRGDLAPELGQGALPERGEHVGAHPLAAGAARSELAQDDAAVGQPAPGGRTPRVPSRTRGVARHPADGTARGCGRSGPRGRAGRGARARGRPGAGRAAAGRPGRRGSARRLRPRRSALRRRCQRR